MPIRMLSPAPPVPCVPPPPAPPPPPSPPQAERASAAMAAVAARAMRGFRIFPPRVVVPPVEEPWLVCSGSRAAGPRGRVCGTQGRPRPLVLQDLAQEVFGPLAARIGEEFL